MTKLVCVILGLGAFTQLACQKSPPVHGRPAPATNDQNASRSRGLVGVWRISRFCTVDSVGRRYDVFGKDPDGHFIFDASGLLSLQIHRTPAGAPAPPDILSDSLFTSDERRMFRDGYLGMFGPYTISSDSTFYYHVDGGSLPTYTGTVQRRTYRILGPKRDTLTMGASGCRILIRAG